MDKHTYNINAIRSAGLQSILLAKQGHPGMTISAAPITYSLFSNFVNISSIDSHWINRDRFILSAGHGSMCWYPILYFSGLITLEQMQSFRQSISGLSGHPEVDNCAYTDATTGPLGQGISNGVGMAIAESYLRHVYSDLPGLIDHYTYVVVGDGDLQEGICYESMSLAGKLGLHKLIVLHDSNKQQLESSVATVNSENLKMRMESMQWNYLSCGNSYNEIVSAITTAHHSTKPTFIEVNTIIGEGLPQSNTAVAHGFSLQQSDISSFNAYFNCDFSDWNFNHDIFSYFNSNVQVRGNKKYHDWCELLKKYQLSNPTLTNQFIKQISDSSISLYDIIDISKLPKNKSTRVVAGSIFQQISDYYPNIAQQIFTISPDISKSTNISISKNLFNNSHTNNMLFGGIREFALLGIQNGIQLHGGIRSVISSFLSFFDYMKAAVRLSAISHLNNIMVFTHDSVAIGSDGPTHQPIEQICTLRTIPNITVYRPCDEVETLASFISAFSNSANPTAIVLSRQDIQSLPTSSIDMTLKYGGYSVFKTNPASTSIITFVSSGSEVQLSIKTAQYLKSKLNIDSEVYSVCNLNHFITSQPTHNFIPSSTILVSIEASNDSTWYHLANIINPSKYINIGVEKFGYSIDGDDNYAYLGLNEIIIGWKIAHECFSSDSNSLSIIDSDYSLLLQSFERFK